MNRLYEDETLINDRFIPYWPDKILDLLDTGAICVNAYFIYMHLRLRAGPYGKVKTSFEEINKDLFEAKKDRSTINKYFLALRKHRLLVYPSRRGERKAIIIYFTDFFDPKAKNRNGSYALVNQKYIKYPDSSSSKSQVLPTSSKENHKLEDINFLTTPAYNSGSADENFTTSNNDKNNEKEKENENDKNNLSVNEKDMVSIRKIMEERKNRKSI